MLSLLLPLNYNQDSLVQMILAPLNVQSLKSVREEEIFIEGPLTGSIFDQDFKKIYSISLSNKIIASLFFSFALKPEDDLCQIEDLNLRL